MHPRGRSSRGGRRSSTSRRSPWSSATTQAASLALPNGASAWGARSGTEGPQEVTGWHRVLLNGVTWHSRVLKVPMSHPIREAMLRLSGGTGQRHAALLATRRVPDWPALPSAVSRLVMRDGTRAAILAGSRLWCLEAASS